MESKENSPKTTIDNQEDGNDNRQHSRTVCKHVDPRKRNKIHHGMDHTCEQHWNSFIVALFDGHKIFQFTHIRPYNIIFSESYHCGSSTTCSMIAYCEIQMVILQEKSLYTVYKLSLPSLKEIYE